MRRSRCANSREEVLPAGSSRSGAADLPLPTSAYQVRPLLFLLDHLRRAVSTPAPGDSDHPGRSKTSAADRLR